MAFYDNNSNSTTRRRGRYFLPQRDPPGTPAARQPRSQLQAAPLSARIRWVVLIILFLGIAATVVPFILLQIRDVRRQNSLEDEVDTAEDAFETLEDLIANLTGPPNCTAVGNVTDDSIFSDALFSVFLFGDNSARFQFDLASLDPGSLVTTQVQDESGVVAYLSDIPPIGSVFEDDVFTVQNAVDTTRQVQLNVGMVASGMTRLMTVQDASGTIAYLSDIPIVSSVFLDDVFAVQSASDPSSEFMFDVSIVSSGTSRTMTVQDTNGTIAYLSDITATGPPFNDTEFIVFETGDPTAQVRLECSGISASTLIVMSVQDDDGTIAYLSDIPQVVQVLVTTTRIFPDIANEGVSNITDLGDITWIEISLCGGGGGGGSGNGGGGGGSGSGIENFRIFSPANLFTQISCTIGAGGTGGTGGFNGTDGTETSVEGVTFVIGYLLLFGYGGGGGTAETSGGAAGGAGGGSGGNANTISPGGAGLQGGLPGGLGGLVVGTNVFTNGISGAINLPWRAGGGGSGATPDTPASGSLGAPWNGAHATNIAACDGSTGCGAASMFGPGGVGSGTADGALCAGGGSGGDGGDGAVLFRYYLF